MINNIINWYTTASYIEMLGMAVIIILALGHIYLVYIFIVGLIDLYIQNKLKELYRQKDRLWDAYNDLYDNYEDLKEHT